MCELIFHRWKKIRKERRKRLPGRNKNKRYIHFIVDT